MNFNDLQGKTCTKVEQKGDDEIHFTLDDGRTFMLHHCQNCCESVVVEEVAGDYADLVGTPILLAEEASNQSEAEDYDSHTWTFYKLRTIKGSVDIRWHGRSNGYYSERVDFDEVKQ